MAKMEIDLNVGVLEKVGKFNSYCVELYSTNDRNPLGSDVD